MLGDSVAIVLAAGKSTRMKSDLPKVLHEICGRPMLAFVLAACRLAGIERSFVVTGHGRQTVVERFEGEKDLVWVDQNEQRGTGHAVLCCRQALAGFEGSVVVIAGDMPLVRRETLADLIESRERASDALALATTQLPDPTGYGRIVRDDEGRLEAIVEHAECTPEQREITEVNPSYYCFDAGPLFEALDQVTPKGDKGEYYLTQVVGILRERGLGVSADVRAAAEDAAGVNSRLDLAAVSRVMQDRIQLGLMADGVTIVDPDNTWIESDVTIGRDTVIEPFSVIRAGAIIGAECRIGPFAHVRASDRVADGSCVGAVSGDGAAAS